MLTLAFEKLHREFIQLSADKRWFVGATTGRRFTPVGFNYDHDEHFRLLEDYWHDEWDKVIHDMTAMRDLGATVVRIHLQLGKFLLQAHVPDEKEWCQLDRLVQLASSLNLYLDLVGLSCYHSWDVPAWYEEMDYQQRWDVQAFFWSTLARRYAHEPTIFCFDLMNEPVVPGRQRPAGGWLGKAFAGKQYIQFITLHGTRGSRAELAQAWLRQLVTAIRNHDSRHLVTVGLVDWSLPSSPMKSGFFPARIVHEVDFICAHLYPEHGRAEEMLKVLKGFCVGKPVIIDETFHLKCEADEQQWFLSEAAQLARGFMGFYTDYLPESLDNGRNQRLRDGFRIFKAVAPLFAKGPTPRPSAIEPPAGSLATPPVNP